MNDVKVISSLDLRHNLPVIRKGLLKGIRYVLLYHGEPIGELLPPSEETREMFFEGDLDPIQPKTSEGKRIQRNVENRKRERLGEK